jgi:hypothetical protein
MQNRVDTYVAPVFESKAAFAPLFRDQNVY